MSVAHLQQISRIILFGQLTEASAGYRAAVLQLSAE